MTSTTVSLAPGDLLQIERRFVVDGIITTQTDEGRFAGVQAVGSAEHLAIECATRNALRLIPLHAIVEITLMESVRREAPALPPSGPAAALPAWDPGVA